MLLQTSKVPFNGCLCRNMKCSCTQQKTRYDEYDDNFRQQSNEPSELVVTSTKADIYYTLIHSFSDMEQYNVFFFTVRFISKLLTITSPSEISPI